MLIPLARLVRSAERDEVNYPATELRTLYARLGTSEFADPLCTTNEADARRETRCKTYSRPGKPARGNQNATRVTLPHERTVERVDVVRLETVPSLVDLYE